jgi:pyrroline-5-carboxylate reductase
LAFVHRNPIRAGELSQELGLPAVPLATAAAYDVAVLAVKPQDCAPVLAALAPALGPGTLVVSLCAGVTISTIDAALPADTPIVQAMPNTPMTIGAAITAVSGGSNATEAHLQLAEGILGTVGKVLRLSETDQDAVTAVSGSGPAYIYYMVEAVIDAATQIGLPREVATELVIETAHGAASMLRNTDRTPVELRADVASTGGTTDAAIDALEAHHFRAAISAAITAAHKRSTELSTSSPTSPSDSETPAVRTYRES